MVLLLVTVKGTLGRNALRLADAQQGRALRVSFIYYFIFELPCGSPRLAFATHSRSMSDCLDRPAQRPSPRPPLLPRRPREAGQLGRLGVPSPGRQAPPTAGHSIGEYSRRRLRVCHRGRRVGRMRWCTAAHLSRRRRIPGPGASSPSTTGTSSDGGCPARRRASEPAGADAAKRHRSLGLAQACLLPQFHSIRVRYGPRRGTVSPREHRPTLSVN